MRGAGWQLVRPILLVHPADSIDEACRQVRLSVRSARGSVAPRARNAICVSKSVALLASRRYSTVLGDQSHAGPDPGRRRHSDRECSYSRLPGRNRRARAGTPAILWIGAS